MWLRAGTSNTESWLVSVSPASKLLAFFSLIFEVVLVISKANVFFSDVLLFLLIK